MCEPRRSNVHATTILSFVACLLASVAIPRPSAAQSSLQVPIEFDFLNPGARSLALGGAFVGLADDATAALVNPAGLIELTKKEASVEGRYRHREQPFLAGGRLSGAPTGAGVDVVATPQFDTIVDAGWTPAFVSFVYPRKKLRLAAFRNELLQVDQQFSSRGVFQNHGFDVRDSAFSADRTISIATYGGSLGYDLGPVWVGGGVLVQHFSLGFDFERYLHESFYGAPDPTQKLFHFTQAGDDTGVGAVVGAVIPLAATKIGLSFKRGARFDFSSFSGGAIGTQQTTLATFKVPDVLAIGASRRIHDSLLLTGEYTRVWHSQLLTDYVDVLTAQGETRDRQARFSINNSNEIHAGAEYLLPLSWKAGIRGGAWFDPDHSVRYAPTPAFDLLDERLSAALSSGRDLWHYTGGGIIGVGNRLDLSAAVDHSSRTTTVSVSVIAYF